MTDTTATVEAVASDIRARFDALDEKLSDQVSDTRLTEMVRTVLPELLDDLASGDGDDAPEFIRKLRFSAGPEQPTAGTKYQRHGLTVGDVEWLYDVQHSLRGQRRVDGDGAYEGPSEELQGVWSKVSEAVYMPEAKVREIDRRAIDNMFPRIPRSAFKGNDLALIDQGRWQDTSVYQRAMDTAETGFGLEIVGNQYVGELWEAARRASRVFGLIETFEMTDPTAFLPVEVDFPELLFVAESTANNSSDYSTVKTGSERVQVDAKKFVIHQMWSGEMEEDSIIPFIPFLRRQAGLSIGHYSDSLVLNGDTTNAGTGNINLDDADPADTKHYLAFDGIRHAGLVDNTANSKDAAGAVTLDLLVEQKGRMIDSGNFVDWGHPTDMNDLVYVADPETADSISQLDPVLTVDKYGPQATILTGELARVKGHPLVPSMAMSKTEADGKVSTTGANNTKGQVAAFNRRGFVWGWRRRVRVETERLPATDQTRIVYSMRSGFGRFSPSGAASGIEAADVLYNITV